MSHGSYLYADDPCLSGEQQLLAALLHVRLTDARYRGTDQTKCHLAEQAQRWLRDRERVEELLTLLGLPDGTYSRLLQKAGLTNEGNIQNNPPEATRP